MRSPKTLPCLCIIGLKSGRSPRLIRSSKMTRSEAARAMTGSAGTLAVRSTSTWPPAEPPLLFDGSAAGSARGRAANDGSDAALWNADGGVTLGGPLCGQQGASSAQGGSGS